MTGLCFSFGELVQETKYFKNIAQKFLDAGTIWALDEFNSRLVDISKRKEGQDCRLELNQILTKPNQGAHDKQSSLNLLAAISGVWDVTPIGPRSKKDQTKRELKFSGIASVKIELYISGDKQTRSAMWRLELGAADAPGCYFHTQILGDVENPPFPKSIPIPRLPSLFATPMSAIEYVLGELFQDQWAESTAGMRHEAISWRKLQKRRLNCLFSWIQRELENPDCSPWMALKRAKPKEDMFL